jgi:hypothetical protein
MLGNSISKFFKLDDLMRNLTGFLEARVELLKIELKEDIAKGLAKAITYLVITFVFALVIFFLSLGVAILLAQKLGDFWGFGIVALFYLVVGAILFFNRTSLATKLEKELSNKLNQKK